MHADCGTSCVLAQRSWSLSQVSAVERQFSSTGADFARQVTLASVQVTVAFSALALASALAPVVVWRAVVATMQVSPRTLPVASIVLSALVLVILMIPLVMISVVMKLVVMISVVMKRIVLLALVLAMSLVMLMIPLVMKPVVMKPVAMSLWLHSGLMAYWQRVTKAHRHHHFEQPLISEASISYTK